MYEDKNATGQVGILLGVKIETDPNDYKKCGGCRFLDLYTGTNPKSTLECILFKRVLDIDPKGSAFRCRRCKIARGQYAQMTWGMSDSTKELVKA